MIRTIYFYAVSLHYWCSLEAIEYVLACQLSDKQIGQGYEGTEHDNILVIGPLAPCNLENTWPFFLPS